MSAKLIPQIELKEWIDSINWILADYSSKDVSKLLERLKDHCITQGVEFPFNANTPYVNTIPIEEEIPYPGDIEIERSIRNIVRWNALSMVLQAGRDDDAESNKGVGGHIATYASAAHLYEVGFNHFFRGANDEQDGDQVYFQGHASPGIYSRAFLEGRLTEENLTNFRRELSVGGGLSSYPHPWLMPNFWQYPTVSMGLGPIMSIYHARFIRYLENRGIKTKKGGKVWAFLGDGEADEPETLGAITLAAREGLNNLIFVVNCNLQRLDGPVRGNGKIIQELEAIFRGAGWNVVKVIWGEDWDPLFAKDIDGLLVKRMEDLVDGHMQEYAVKGGEYIREAFFNSPELKELIVGLSTEQIAKLRRGGHDIQKIYNAYLKAVSSDKPTVILAQTIKGFGLGEEIEAANTAHQIKKMDKKGRVAFRDKFRIPISIDAAENAEFYCPSVDSEEILYLKSRREKLGGYLPKRENLAQPISPLPEDIFSKRFRSIDGKSWSTTRAFVYFLQSCLLNDKKIGQYIVPIVPDEGQTFGMQSLYKSKKIYSSVSQKYTPVDVGTMQAYNEATDGQILQEGISEAGAMSSFIAAGTAYANHGINTIPFFIYYSMFGFQRVGDLIWAAADMRCRGFLLGGTAGRTTLNGEGLQHQDGHSHLAALSVPNLLAYDPAFHYEIATIISDGIDRMYRKNESIFYYLTLGNENYQMLPQPKYEDVSCSAYDSIEDGITKGLYKIKKENSKKKKGLKVHLCGSGAILNEVLKAMEILRDKPYDISVDVWSVTSYKAIYNDGIEADQWNLLNVATDQEPQVPYLTRCFEDENGVVVFASDYVKAIPNSILKWLCLDATVLGTDGFGRSEDRARLRDFFQVDAKHIVLAALTLLLKNEQISQDLVQTAISELKIDLEKPDPTKV